MRLIGTLNDPKRGLDFSHFLGRKGIVHHIEVATDKDWGSSNYGTSKCDVWIYEEDDVDQAVQWLEEFQANPQNPLFTEQTIYPWPILKDKISPVQSPIEQTEKKIEPIVPPQKIETPPKLQWERSPMGIITRLILLTCCLLLFAAKFINPPVAPPEGLSGSSLLFTSPLEKTLLYDYPYTYTLIDRLIKLYGFEALESTKDLPTDAQQLVNQINKTPFWDGIYPLIQKFGFSEGFKKAKDIPKFEKIQQGQYWRLITPVFLHADIFHLFFNMLWLIVLGKQIEQRLSPFRYIILILLLGVFSNTAQYLMSGPNFIGFSGILCGMLTFIWMRLRYAPWEGYELDRMTIMFMLLFIFSMAALQVFSFFIEKSYDLNVSPHIANMAHLSGAFFGLILGRLNFFRWRTA